MTENNSQEEINSRRRGPRGCFARFFARFLSLFKKKDKRHSKGKNGDPRKHSVVDLTSKTSLCKETEVVQQNNEEQREATKEEVESKVVKTWAEDVDEAEELALDVFAETSGTLLALQQYVTPETVIHSDITVSTECEAVAAETSGTVLALQHYVTPETVIHNDITAPTECEAECGFAGAAASTHIKINASKRRRARRVAAAAARRVSRSSCAETSKYDAARNYYHYHDSTNNDEATRDYYRYYENTNQEEAAQDYYRYYENSNQDAAAQDYYQEEASRDYYRYYESTNHYVEAQEYYQYYDNLNQHEGAQDYYRYYQTSNQDEAAYDYYQHERQEQRRDMVPAEVPYRRPTRPSPSVRVFGRDGRPLVCQWEDGYAAFHAQRHTKGKAAH